MKMKVAGLVIALGITGWAQQKQSPLRTSETKREGVRLGSAQVYLGESKAETLATLVSAGCKVNAFGDEKRQFAVYVSQQGSVDKLVGNIAFTGERLTFINKNWNSEQPSGYDLAKAIFFAVRSLNDEGCDSVRLATESTYQPKGQIRTVVLYCEGTSRKFEITALDLSAETPPTATSLSEILQTSN